MPDGSLVVVFRGARSTFRFVSFCSERVNFGATCDLFGLNWINVYSHKDVSPEDYRFGGGLVSL